MDTRMGAKRGLGDAQLSTNLLYRLFARHLAANGRIICSSVNLVIFMGTPFKGIKTKTLYF